MKRSTSRQWPIAVMLIFAAGLSAQAAPTAARRLQLSSFVLLGETYTGLSAPVTNLGGRNFTATLGADLSVFDVHRTSIELEVRGAYPAYNGQVDGQKSLLGGLRGEYRFANPKLARLRIYVDLLAGRGSIEYVGGGYPSGNLLYTRSSSDVLTEGGGLRFALTRRWSILGDAQLSRWHTPVLPSGTLFSAQGSGGLGFAFHFGGAGPH